MDCLGYGAWTLPFTIVLIAKLILMLKIKGRMVQKIMAVFRLFLGRVVEANYPDAASFSKRTKDRIVKCWLEFMSSKIKVARPLALNPSITVGSSFDH